MGLRDELKGSLSLSEVSELTEFAIGFAKERPTEKNVYIAQLILKAAGQTVQALEEFADGYQVRGELHELSENAARLIHNKLQQIELLALCAECRKLMNEVLRR